MSTDIKLSKAQISDEKVNQKTGCLGTSFSLGSFVKIFWLAQSF